MDGAFPSQKGQDFGDSESGYSGGRGGGRGGGRSGFRGTAENAKTKLCNRCNFAHGDNELRQGQDHDDSQSNGGRGYGGGQRGRGYGYGGRASPGRSYGGGRGGYPGGGGGYPVMGQYQGGYGMEQPHAGFEQRPGGMPDDQYAVQGCPVAGPNGWCLYRAKDTGEAYYHNHKSGVTQWDRPADWN